MARTVTASEAKKRLGSIMDWAVENWDEVVVEKRGNPRVAIVPFGEYQKLVDLREHARRAEALARLERIAREAQQRNKDLSPEEADELADRFVRDVIEDMVTEGKIKFREA